MSGLALDNFESNEDRDRAGQQQQNGQIPLVVNSEVQPIGSVAESSILKDRSRPLSGDRRRSCHKSGSCQVDSEVRVASFFDSSFNAGGEEQDACSKTDKEQLEMIFDKMDKLERQDNEGD